MESQQTDNRDFIQNLKKNMSEKKDSDSGNKSRKEKNYVNTTGFLKDDNADV